MSKLNAFNVFGGIALLSFSAMTMAETTTVRHGYVSNPPSRSFLCSAAGGNINKNCGSIAYEPQSLEAPKGFPESGPQDGKIASAGHDNYSELDEQTADRWHHVALSTGEHSFTWTLTAAHKTEKWRFYITKKGWNPGEKLTREQFDLTKPICERDDAGKLPESTVTIKGCQIPADYKGYHVILGVWDVADTGNAFYQVIDTDIQS